MNYLDLDKESRRSLSLRLAGCMAMTLIDIRDSLNDVNPKVFYGEISRNWYVSRLNFTAFIEDLVKRDGCTP